jgi:pimeloyl-ACP methyl ester carboxylesterase
MRRSTLLGVDTEGLHRLVYYEWGDPDNERVLVCAHGLTRNGRDFDWLARALSDRYRVLCLDFPGRGLSDWLPVKQDYGYPLYVRDAVALIARAGVQSVDWVGTSMGGLVGMTLASFAHTPIRRLVLNDVGPFLPEAAIQRIAGYVGDDPRFADEGAFEGYLRVIYEPFGPLSDAHWEHLYTHSRRTTPEGDIGLAYDPGIGVPIRETPPADVKLWEMWARLHCPILVLRGETSDVLLETTARQMAHREHTTLVELAGVGHAPMLMSQDQIAVLRDWLA